jgi:hypothetical protein
MRAPRAGPFSETNSAGPHSSGRSSRRYSDLKTARDLNSLPTNVRSVFYEFGLSSMAFVPNGSYWPEFAGSRYDQWAQSWDGASSMDGFGNAAL